MYAEQEHPDITLCLGACTQELVDREASGQGMQDKWVLGLNVAQPARKI